MGECGVGPIDKERLHLSETGFELLHEMLNGDRLVVRHGKLTLSVSKSRSGAVITWAARPLKTGSAFSPHAPVFSRHNAEAGARQVHLRDVSQQLFDQTFSLHIREISFKAQQVRRRFSGPFFAEK